MNEEFASVVGGMCREPQEQRDEVGRRTFEHLRQEVEAILASFASDGVVLDRICPQSERGDLAAVVASVLVREAARVHDHREFAPCASCGNLSPRRERHAADALNESGASLAEDRADDGAVLAAGARGQRRP